MSEKQSNRRFTKKLVLINIAAAWLVLAISLPLEMTESVIVHILTFISTLVAIYTGVGHLDYRKFVERSQASHERSEAPEHQ